MTVKPKPWLNHNIQEENQKYLKPQGGKKGNGS